MIDSTPAYGVLTIPNGEYEVSQGSGYFNLRITKPITIRGEETTVIRQLPTGPSVRAIQVDAPDSTFERLIMDGNADAQTVNEHQAAFFITKPGCVVRQCSAGDFMGDGIYAYVGASNLLLEDVICRGNRRNGVTMGGSLDNVNIIGGTFRENLAQQIDSEPGAPQIITNVMITKALIVASPSNDYALTVSGTGSGSRSKSWRIVGNKIYGATNIVWADDVVMAGNEIINDSTKPAIRVYRSCNQTLIAKNRIADTRTTNVDGTERLFPSAIWAVGTGLGQSPSGLIIDSNDITCAARSSLGVRSDGIISALIVGNSIIGGGIPHTVGSGVYARATIAEQDFERISIIENVIAGFGLHGIEIQGNGMAKLRSLYAISNQIGNDTPAQHDGMSLDDRTHALVASVVLGNIYGSGVTTGKL